MPDKPDEEINALLNAPVLFGLRAQGHLETIETMLRDGNSWDEIADAIGWERRTARSHYESAVGPEETRELRAALAEAIETLRIIRGYRLNRAAEAYLHGNNLLESKTKFDF